jgi:hypothetical protein
LQERIKGIVIDWGQTNLGTERKGIALDETHVLMVLAQQPLRNLTDNMPAKHYIRFQLIGCLFGQRLLLKRQKMPVDFR